MTTLYEQDEEGKAHKPLDTIAYLEQQVNEIDSNAQNRAHLILKKIGHSPYCPKDTADTQTSTGRRSKSSATAAALGRKKPKSRGGAQPESYELEVESVKDSLQISAPGSPLALKNESDNSKPGRKKEVLFTEPEKPLQK